jgi:hypothetical protein
MGERVNGIHEVGGSIPPGSTNLRRFASFGSASRSHWAAFLLQSFPVSAADKSRHPIA